MTIESERTRLRLIESADLMKVHSILSLPETDEYNVLGISEHEHVTKSILDQWVSNNQQTPKTNYIFAIEGRVDESFIGLFGLNIGQPKYRRAEVWFKIHPDYWNKGFATEILKCVIDFAFKALKLHRIEAGCAVENIGSKRVLEKAGMKQEGRGRQVLPLRSGWSDNYEYAILESDDWESVS